MKIEQTELRIETKYIVNSKNLNKFLFEINKYGFIQIYPYRYINSLYYDDSFLSSVTQNLSGITPRYKYRIRWYSSKNENKDFGWQFEKKIKNSLLSYKKICKLKDDFYKENDFSLRNLISNNKKILNLVNIDIEPKLICNYLRNYYENKSGIRLTIDSKIKFKKFSEKIDLKNSYLWQYTNLHIVELKFKEEMISEISQIIKNFPFNSSRCSKYLLAHSKLNGLKYI